MGAACSCERGEDVDSATTVGQPQSIRHSRQELAAEDEAAAKKAATQAQEVTRPTEDAAAAGQTEQPSVGAGNTSLPQVAQVCDESAREIDSDRSIDTPAAPPEHTIMDKPVQAAQLSGQLGSAASPQSPPVTQVCDERPEEIDLDRSEGIDLDPLTDQPPEQVVPNLSGVWKHTHDDDMAMDQLLTKDGVGWVKKKAFGYIHATITIKQEGDQFDIEIATIFHTNTYAFKVGGEFQMFDPSKDKDVIFGTSWENQPGQPTKYHQFIIGNKTRGVRRWLEPNEKHGGTQLVQELEIEGGFRAKRYFQAVAPAS